MTDKHKRSWFQIHLSTAIVLMLLASALLFVNVRVFENITEDGKSSLTWSNITNFTEFLTFQGIALFSICIAVELNSRRREARKP